MTLAKFGKIAAVSAALCSFAAVAAAQSQGQTYQQQQQAYYRAWQQYYQQYYGQNYQQPAYQQQGRYTTTQPQRAGAWATQQKRVQPVKQGPAAAAAGGEVQDAQDEYPVVKHNLAGKSAQTVDLDSRDSENPAKKSADTSVWYSSFDPAWKAARADGRPLVLLFVHQGCPECNRMDSYLAQPGAMQTLACAVKARIEFTENPATVSRFGVKLTPTFLVLAPQGTEAYREVGALDVNRLRQIQPALESLVTGPSTADATELTGSSDAKKDVSYAPNGKLPAKDKSTSKTIAAL